MSDFDTNLMKQISPHAVPCPCCDSRDVTVGVSHAFGYNVRCENCGMRTKDFNLPDYCSKKNLVARLMWRALRAWNRRPLVRAGRVRRPADQFLTKERMSIMDHTIHRAAGGYYCGGGKDMKALVGAGLMQLAGNKSFVEEDYFRITYLGRKILGMQRFKHLLR